MKSFVPVILLGAAGIFITWCGLETEAAGPLEKPVVSTATDVETVPSTSKVPQPRPLAPFVQKSIVWLVEAQHPDGGWGAGSHANQQQRDHSQVVTDPATTAFSATALLRAGHTPTAGTYQETMRLATEYLVKTVESAPEGPRVTNLTGTQPQSKLGQIVDTTMTSHFLARVLPTLPQGSLRTRVDAALDTCIAKLQQSQKQDGSWNTAGWAPVLQSSMNTSALELAQAAGKKVDKDQLDRARDYQKNNYDAKTGRADPAAAAGVELYAFAGAQRANAVEARQALEIVNQAKAKGELEEDAPVNAENLRKVGVAGKDAEVLSLAYTDSRSQAGRLQDEALLKGFGNNGGEEYLSYMMTSESLVLAGGEDWDEWNDKMHRRLEKIQSPDGSWTGHHCITSPVFCTAAVIQTLTADRDAPILFPTLESDSE